MFRRLTSRRALKWTGTIACILIAAVFVANWWYWAQFRFSLNTHALGVGVLNGSVCVVDYQGWAEWWEERPDVVVQRDRRPGLVLWPQSWLSIAPELGCRWSATVPLWIPFILLVIPTAWFWRLDRRRPLPGHCRKCNYDLTGNTSGRCPECGTDISKTEPSSANEPAGGNVTGV